ncbi:MAG TPA: glycosyltransferase family 4 protein [Candidatus Koribacter sp.]
MTPNEHKLLLNPVLLGLRAIGAKRVAFWGKGDLVASGVMQPAEWLRYKMANAVDWWFPYTEESAAHLRRLGVSCGITPIGNAVDTSELRRELSEFSDDCLRQSRNSIGISSGPVGIFCGNLSANKDLDFLFAAAKRIHDAIPAFVLLVVGNGPLRQHVEIVATHERFIRYVGPRIGREKALLLALSDVFLLPGAVGLAVLDSFAAGLPLLTTDGPKHGPEVNYLEAGLNGVISAHDVRTYADAVVGLLQNPRGLARMRAEALKSATQYSLENMVENFRRGILDCLQVRARREQSELARALAKAAQSRSGGD